MELLVDTDGTVIHSSIIDNQILQINHTEAVFPLPADDDCALLNNREQQDDHDAPEKTIPNNRLMTLLVTQSKKRHPVTWNRSVPRQLRMEGKAYTGYKNSNRKFVNDNKRAERKIRPACTSKECIRASTKNYAETVEEQRIDIFIKFWSSTNWKERKVYVVNHVTALRPKRTYTSAEKSRKRKTLTYSLTINKNKVQVRKKCFGHN